MKVKLIWNLDRHKWAILSEEREFFRPKHTVLGWAGKVRLQGIGFSVEDGRPEITGNLFGVEGVEWKGESYAPTLALLKPTGNGAAMVTYDPYKNDTFVSEGREVRWASWAVFDNGRIFARWVEPYHPSLLLENDSVGIRDYYTHKATDCRLQ